MTLAEASPTIHLAIHSGATEVVPYEGASSRAVRVDRQGRRFVRIPIRNGKTITWVAQDNRREHEQDYCAEFTSYGHTVTRIQVDGVMVKWGVLEGTFTEDISDACFRGLKYLAGVE